MGLATEQVVARFESERQVLARMEHPGIARVVDAGATPDATLVRRLGQDSAYAPLFETAFGSPRITPDRIGRALAEFVHSMVSLRSKFDNGIALAGSIDKEFANFSAQENRGRRLFFGLTDNSPERSCSSCHMQHEPVPSSGAGNDRPASRRELLISGQTAVDSEKSRMTSYASGFAA